MLFSACKNGSDIQNTPNTSKTTSTVLPNAGEPQFDYDYNPLTGGALPEGFEKGQRPVAIMVNNSVAAYPQRGIGSADVLYEMVTEGGVTRLMALFSDRRTIPQVGPVRSARDQHLQICLPTNSIFVHIGSSIYASNLLNEQRYQDIDGMFLGTTSFAYDEQRSLTYANEHCWFTDAALLQAGIDKYALPVQGSYKALFSFIDKAESKRVPTQAAAPDVKWTYSSIRDAMFSYAADTNLYLKSTLGAPHIDELTGVQLGFTNVFLLFDTVTLKSDQVCTDFALRSGKGYYFTGGAYEEIMWKKGAPTDELVLLAKDGTPLKVNIGKSYVGIVGEEQAKNVIIDTVAAAAAQAALEAAAAASAPVSSVPVA